MSLRARLVLMLVLLNLAVVGVVQLGVAWAYRDWFEGQQQVYHKLLQAVLSDAYRWPGRAENQWVRVLLQAKSLRTEFRDVMISSGAAGGAEGFVDLNPMGAAYRDTDFPIEEVRNGIRRVRMEPGQNIAVADGFVVPIELGGKVEAAAWYVPTALPTISTAFFVIPVLLSSLLIPLLAYFSLGRSVVQPLEKLGLAATRVGAGESGVRVEPVARAPELNVLVDAFNAMAATVAGHTEELRREVERATAEAARRERALVSSSRLAAMGTLAAGIAHEINNPIGGMMNAAHSLLKRDDLDERARVYLQLILEGLDRVGAIARRVLDFSPREVDAAPFGLGDAVEGARQLVEHRCTRQGVDLRRDLPADLPEIMGNRHEIQQVLLNFFINSLDALDGREGPSWISVHARPEGEWVVVDIEDNGPGADPQTLSRVLDPFFSSKESPTASGLGLFISYSIIKNHGGEMEVDSAPEKGFRVRLKLPSRA